MAAVNTSRSTSFGVALFGAASLVLTLTACGSESDDTTATPATAATTCPDAESESSDSPDWTFEGTTGSVSVTGSTESASPVIEVEAPFSVDETQVETLVEGDGPVVSDTAEVSVCYVGVNGRDGNVFDSSYQRGAPAEFPLDGVVTGFQKAIAGQTVGSKVAVAMTSDDGYGNGQPAAGIEAGDSLVFAIDILDVVG